MDDEDRDGTSDLPENAIQTRYRAEESPSMVITTGIAALTDTPPTELDPLYNSINPEALDSLLSEPTMGDEGTELPVEFTASGYQVIAHGDGRITILDDE